MPDACSSHDNNVTIAFSPTQLSVIPWHTIQPSEPAACPHSASTVLSTAHTSPADENARHGRARVSWSLNMAMSRPAAFPFKRNSKCWSCQRGCGGVGVYLGNLAVLENSLARILPCCQADVYELWALQIGCTITRIYCRPHIKQVTAACHFFHSLIWSWNANFRTLISIHNVILKVGNLQNTGP